MPQKAEPKLRGEPFFPFRSQREFYLQVQPKGLSWLDKWKVTSLPITRCLQLVWEKVTETEALYGHKAMKLLTWQMNILISITGVFKWNAFIFPYLQAHVFLFLISLKKKSLFFSWYLVPNKGSGNQLRTLLQPTPALIFTSVESTSKETVKWKESEFTVTTEQKKMKNVFTHKGWTDILLISSINKNPSWPLPQFPPASSRARIPVGEGSGVGVWGLSFVWKPWGRFSICMAESDAAV